MYVEYVVHNSIVAIVGVVGVFVDDCVASLQYKFSLVLLLLVCFEVCFALA